MHLLDQLRRAFRWHRRGFAALAVAVAVLAGLNAIASPTAGGLPVVVAQRPITAGSTLTASDLAVVALPASMVPESALSDPAPAIGQLAVVAVPARQVLTGSVLLGAEGQVGPGRVALPVSFGVSGAVSLLRVGSRIDVLGANASGSGYGVVAASVRVAALPGADDPGPLGGTTSRLVLLEVSSAQAADIAAAMSVSAVNFALH